MISHFSHLMIEKTIASYWILISLFLVWLGLSSLIVHHSVPGPIVLNLNRKSRLHTREKWRWGRKTLSTLIKWKKRKMKRQREEARLKMEDLMKLIINMGFGWDAQMNYTRLLLKTIFGNFSKIYTNYVQKFVCDVC